MTPKLSLCIPTFNRADVLNQCLSSIVPQCEAAGAEICISDNASVDHTVAVVEEWQKRYPAIHLNRHEKNLRIDRNIVAAGALATGDVIWFLSDDDVLEPGAVNDVLAMIGRHPTVPSFIVNRREYDAALVTPVGDVRVLTPRAGHDGEASVPLEEALVGVAEYLGYLPAWVIRREAWTQIQPREFLDTDFVHVGVGLAGSKLWSQRHGYPANIVLSNRPIIRCRLARASWRNRHYEVWIRNWHKTLRELQPYLTGSSVNDAIAIIVRRNYVSIVSGRAFSTFGVSDYALYLKPFLASPVKRVIALLVALSPRWTARAFTMFQRFVRERLA